MSAFETLLQVQDRDMAIDRLGVRRAELPARSELAGIEARIAELADRQDGRGAERDQLARRRDDLDAEVASVTDRIAQIERRMYGGEVSASRELQAMSEEVASLSRRRSELEDREVDAMEALEPIEADVAAMAADREALEAEAERVRSQIATAEEEIDAEAAVEEEARADLAAAVPADLARDYERLRARLGGVGAARLANGTCGGCHLALPAAELEAIRRAPPEEVITCEQCGRILVR